MNGPGHILHHMGYYGLGSHQVGMDGVGAVYELEFKVTLMPVGRCVMDMEHKE
jgi:hypothetical protein